MPKSSVRVPRSALSAFVRKALRSADLPAIARQSGLPLAWLLAYAKGYTKSPGVNRVEHLYTVITGKKLAL